MGHGILSAVVGYSHATQGSLATDRSPFAGRPDAGRGGRGEGPSLPGGKIAWPMSTFLVTVADPAGQLEGRFRTTLCDQGLRLSQATQEIIVPKGTTISGTWAGIAWP